ncbi:MAG: hypothetical protein NHB32_06460 [Fischerella sp. CENA71]|nr:hypothetical protein [Fischerella sp. CENA71]
MQSLTRPDIDTAQLIAALQRHEQLLQHILNALDKPQLGLHSNAGSIKIYCNRQHGHLWYTLTNSEPTAVCASALTGYLRELKFEQTKRRGKPCHKLLAFIQGDRPYILESGHDSHFTKGLLSAIASLTPQQLMQPITISPQAGDDDKVLFVRIWAGCEYVKAQYSEDTDWRATAKQAIAVVTATNNMPSALTREEF